MVGDEDADFLIEGVRNGFRIVDESITPVQCRVSNYSSALDQRQAVEAQLRTEIAEGRLVVVDKRPTIVSALGAIPKPDGGIRLIHDCSQPRGQAVNDYAFDVDQESYASVRKAAELTRKGSYMAKIDLKAAYRSVRLHPSQYNYTGLEWTFTGDDSPTFLVDTCLCFGAKLAPGTFHQITQSVVRLMWKWGYILVAYLDDFLVIANSSAECMDAMNVLLRLLRYLGFAISWQKTEGPCQKLTFLGVSIDTTLQTLSLPQSKVEEIKLLLDTFSQRTRASQKQLQKLAGKLSWAAQVVRGGRIYLQRLLDTMRPLKGRHHKVRLAASFKSDILWWQRYFSEFNASTWIFPNNVIQVFTDASSVDQESYASVRKAAELTRKGSYMAKIDLKAAYRSVRLRFAV